MKFINGWTKDKVMERLREKNGFKRCLSDSGTCLYRDSDGMGCFVGAFIPDSKYSAGMSGGVYYLMAIFGTALKLFMPMHIDDLSKFQLVHDTYRNSDKDTLEEKTSIFLDQFTKGD